MWKKIILGFIIIASCVWWYGLVFGGNFVFDSEVKFVTSIGKGVYLDDPILSKGVVIFYSDSDISSAEIVSSCDTTTEFLEYHKGLYFFSLDHSKNDSCFNPYISLKDGDEILANVSGKLQPINKSTMLSTFLDYSDEHLTNLKNNIQVGLTKQSIYKNYNGEDIAKNFSLLKKQRAYYEGLYTLNLLEEILSKRQTAYDSPVPGYSLQTEPNKVPNAGRPYRASYTDGIHHGWDIDTPYDTLTAALDDGIIVRIVDDFDDSDFNNIVYGSNISEMQKLKNLDVLRGNQVWLKTMKWEVVFYSHLSSVDLDIQEWDFVSRWTPLWKIGVSWVPGNDYHDYHLHFAIMENPYVLEDAGSYDFWDYMAWDWLTRWKSYSEVIAAQKRIFK